jgi:hypothetical protein
MSEFTHVLIILAAIVTNIIAIKKFAYNEENQPSCDNYVFNTYLYVLLLFLIMSIILVLSYNNIGFENIIHGIFSSWFGFISFMIVYIALFFTLQSLSPKRNQLALYITWLGLIIMFTILMHFPIKIAHVKGFLQSAIVITLCLVSAMSYLGIKHGDYLVKFDWDAYLGYALIGLILTYMIIPFLGDIGNMNNIYIYISIFSLIIFCLLLLSFNKQLVERSKTCYEDNNPNYPLESIKIGTKIINILQDIINIKSRLKKRA